MDNCRACRAPVRWAITNNGKRSPLDDEPSREGNVALLMAQGERSTIDFAVVLTGQALARCQQEGVLLRTPHFATCPRAGEFRKPKGDQAAPA